MTEEEKKLLQAKHRLEEAQARDRVKERKARKEYGLSNTKVYIDDGITGTKFDRPGFQKMIDDIEAGYISTVMVKDLSRLGRDYILSGYYSDVYFPDRNVRFIAVNDCVDSTDGENEIAPFKNVMNEMYRTAGMCSAEELQGRYPSGRCG